MSGLTWDSTNKCPHDDLSREHVLAWHALQHPDCKLLELVGHRCGRRQQHTNCTLRGPSAWAGGQDATICSDNNGCCCLELCGAAGPD